METQISSLISAREVAFQKPQLYTDIFHNLLPFIYNQNTTLQTLVIDFLKESFVDEKLDKELQLQLADELLQPLSYLISSKSHLELPRAPSPANFVKIIQLTNHIYPIIFKKCLSSPQMQDLESKWDQLQSLRDNLIQKFGTAYPLLPLNPESDASRSTRSNITLVMFITNVLSILSIAPPKDPRAARARKLKNTPEDLSIVSIPSDHKFLNMTRLEVEGRQILDVLFDALNDSRIINSPLFCVITNRLLTLFKKRPGLVSVKLFDFMIAYESMNKEDPLFESNQLKMRLIRRFNDRILKVMIGYCLNKSFVKDTKLLKRFQNKFTYYQGMFEDQRKRGLLKPDSHEIKREEKRAEFKKKKITGNESLEEQLQNNPSESPLFYYNSSPITPDLSYSSLYSLISPNNKLASFNMSELPQNILIDMIAYSLQNTTTRKLVKGLEIISDRFQNVMKFQQNYTISQDQDIQIANVPDSVKREDDKDLQDDYNPDLVYELPLPNYMTFKDQKKQLLKIISQFMELAQLDYKQPILSDVSNDDSLNGVALSSWKENTWLVFLTRLATRGLCDAQHTNEDGTVENLNDLVRDAIFTYFTADIRGRIDVVIDWLNEEWICEVARNRKEDNEVPDTPVYNAWGSKVLDNIIPFMENSDRKIFLRLLSELPSLNEQMVEKIKSICLDPIRYKFGFVSLQFLIMFRPPLKDIAINLFRRLYQETDLDDLKAECLSYLKKYCPGEYT
ncbi:mRNA and snoRNA 3' ends cleavage and polyadenylation protein [Komagataella phaffii CBS 7435]|uniref:Subunit of holo-CPF, a multiprotein complex and functional homolog of mammalian CPSF n=2 Tax=Komagataella phaffii TaxID=460519 RepID=C4R554_KOMPG|nr:Subunit of holo-CPF, a multiprotein complex and functional homolog of mammalian CPSF [Komagataella phaffii GS115]AOA63539.1 GQ67_03726T0 [Komagataella phaffii]CAH2449536.1 mRNA and snoRNA 3' ends cleavage and polyadenylation protein [Komagataella phaffii CBS 7435]AOA68370.1 GQ68_03698T0 [Komagataella phaffii GS115]CAY70690.1 Subunit of holo-CPF, a multiprotein complex and functional homolog of mammalian CPSF [Komagataella phaffii GS115]CCA39518.1 mRNA and snoRNA 3' ends cleavage and polyade